MGARSGRTVASAVLLASLGAGCAVPPPDSPPDSPEARLEACRAALREERTACREGLKKDDAPYGFRCLSARQRVQRYCD